RQQRVRTLRVGPLRRQPEDERCFLSAALGLDEAVVAQDLPAERVVRRRPDEPTRRDATAASYVVIERIGIGEELRAAQCGADGIAGQASQRAQRPEGARDDRPARGVRGASHDVTLAMPAGGTDESWRRPAS